MVVGEVQVVVGGIGNICKQDIVDFGAIDKHSVSVIHQSCWYTDSAEACSSVFTSNIERDCGTIESEVGY